MSDLFIDLEPFCGRFVWQEIVINGSNFCVPDIEWCGRFIILCIIIYFFLKGIFNICHLFV